jgi:hypothetical protein
MELIVGIENMNNTNKPIKNILMKLKKEITG